VNAVLQALGPVGDVLGWLLDRGEQLASALWREAVLAIRFVKKSVSEILDWAASQTQAIFERLIQLCEDVGAAVTEIIDWGIARGQDVLEVLGGLWERIGNSVDYALNYLATDFIPGIAKFVKGALGVGYELARLVLFTAAKAFEVTLEVVRGALEAGVTLAELFVETLKHPDQAVQNFARAARQLGKTITEVGQAFHDAGEEFADQFARTMLAIGENAKDMLLAVLEISVGWIDTVVFVLMTMLNGFRTLTAAEKTDAEAIFADTVDLDKVYIATESPTNSIIFGIQDFFTGEPDSRAFVTGNLINFDADDIPPLERYTFIHEMTHVWQHQNVGPIYMAHAIFGQITTGYNYGYVDSNESVELPNGAYDGSTQFEPRGHIDGTGAEGALAAGGGDITTFNPEQQGQIMMHYFVRRHLLNQTPAQYAAWQPYVDFVKSHPPVA
jgi:hypothetical protein